jgi:hypothetical protein
MVDLLGEARFGDAERKPQLIEPVADDEQRHEDDRQEADPTGARRLADDPGAAFRRQAVDGLERWSGRESLGRHAVRWARCRKALLGRRLGRVRHRAPRGFCRRNGIIRCSRSASVAG